MAFDFKKEYKEFYMPKNNLFSVFGVRTISCLGSLSFASLHTSHSDGLYTATIKEL